jgi:CheY-like chemotaxis protein
MLRFGLERQGFRVWLTNNGPEAIDLYQQHREEIDLVLLDVQMPVLDGPQTLDALRRLDPEVRACFMSGASGRYGSEELWDRGALCLFAKPFRIDDLTRILWKLALLLARDTPRQRQV